MTAQEPLVVVTQLELAALLGVDRNTIAAWTHAGLPVAHRGRGSRGHEYDLGACVRWTRQRDRAQAEEALTVAKAARGSDVARSRKWTADARRAELDVRRREAEVIPVVEVDRRWAAIAVQIRTELSGLPTRLRARCPEATVAVVTAADALIREALEALADRRGAAKPEEVRHAAQ